MKSVSVTLCGLPNVGKSTILNAMLGEKLSIVTPKPQTTRNAIRGILTEDNNQIQFVDTPGIFKPKTHLQKVIVKNAWQGIDGVDIACFVIDASKGWGKTVQQLAEYINAKIEHMVCIVNKIDTSKVFSHNYKVADLAFQTGLFKEIFPVCATKQRGLGNLRQYLFAQMKESEENIFDPDYITDRPSSFIAAEITRETIFLQMQEEIPYMIHVEPVKFEMSDNGIDIIQQIFVISEMHKAMLLGKHGSMIKKIRLISQGKMSHFFNNDVLLDLDIKVRPQWYKNITYD